MNLHEYQGKALFAEYGLPVSTGHAVESAEAAVKAAAGNRWSEVGCEGAGSCRWSRQSGGRQVGRVPEAAGEFAAAMVGRALGDLSDGCFWATSVAEF